MDASRAVIGLAYLRAVEVRTRAEDLFLPRPFTSEASLQLDSLIQIEEAFEAVFIQYVEAA